jgi:hypothetical protein
MANPRPHVHQEPTRHPLGRLISPDVRDAAYRFAVHRDALQIEKTAGTRHWYTGKDLPVDQGPSPRCVGFSTATMLMAGPVTQRKAIPDTAAGEKLAGEIYTAALDLDEFDGNDPCCGTSVRAGMKAAQARGFLTSYLWGSTVREAMLFVLNHGPVVFGTVWPDSMMETDADGVLWVAADSTLDGPHAQGHAYCAVGVSTSRKFGDGTTGGFRISQSWGRGWGDGGSGMAWIPFSQMEKLLASAGEVAMPTEIRIK